jgi:hypothetical protein
MHTGGFELASSALTSSTLKCLHRIECGFKFELWRYVHCTRINLELRNGCCAFLILLISACHFRTSMLDPFDDSPGDHSPVAHIDPDDEAAIQAPSSVPVTDIMSPPQPKKKWVHLLIQCTSYVNFVVWFVLFMAGGSTTWHHLMLCVELWIFKIMYKN